MPYIWAENAVNIYFETVVLLLLAYCLRDDIFFMVLPVLCLTVIYKFYVASNHKYIYIGVFGTIIASALLIGVVQKFAFSSSEWKYYLEFRENRKDIHDYSGYPDYEENREFYENLGISQDEYNCLKKVNVALNYGQDDVVFFLQTIREYNASIKDDTILEKVGEGWEKFENYLGDKRLLCTLGLYVLMSIFLILDSIKNKQKTELLFMVMIMLSVCAEIVYICYKGRVLLRSMLPIVLVPTILMGGVFFNKIKTEKYVNIMIGAICAFVIVTCMGQMATIKTTKNTKILASESNDMVTEYCKARPNNFYFTTAYFLPSATDKITFAYYDKTFENRAVLGGWNCYSPQWFLKLESGTGYSSAEEALLYAPNVYFLGNKNEKTLIENYFKSRYDNVGIFEIDLVETDIDEYGVYQIRLQ